MATSGGSRPRQSTTALGWKVDITVLDIFGNFRVLQNPSISIHPSPERSLATAMKPRAVAHWTEAPQSLLPPA